MAYLKIKNWEQYQHYSKRNPPWIKLYYTLLDDYKFGRLQDDSKLLYICLLLLASRCDNKIPNDPHWISQRCNIYNKVDLEPLISAGFISIIDDDSNVLSKCYQDDSKMLVSGREETETETEKSNEKNSPLSSNHWKDVLPEILYLRDAITSKADGKNFKCNQWIKSKLKIKGHPKAICLCLERLNKEYNHIKNKWAYCERIFEVENGNFNEREHTTAYQDFDQEEADKLYKEFFE